MAGEGSLPAAGGGGRMESFGRRKSPPLMSQPLAETSATPFRKPALMKTAGSYIAATLLAASFAVFAAPCPGRTWTDASGEHTFEARLLDLNGGRVWLRHASRGSFSVPLQALSRADQQYVREEIRRRDAAIKVRPTGEGDVAYGPGRELCKLASEAVDESSGLACSRRAAGVFWTHNDSGDDSRIYAFDATGRDLGSCLLPDVRAYDWEDMASFRLGEKCYLLVCDTGNNGRAAAVQMLHVVEEPRVDPRAGVTAAEVPIARTIHYSYEDDHRDCEAVALDPTEKAFYMVTRERGGQECYVYRLPWPEKDADKAFVARKTATLGLPEVTAMDIAPDGRRAIVLTYRDAYEYRRGAEETWRDAFSRAPRRIALPQRAQGESVCYGPDGKTLYLTSEQRPTPLLEVPVR